MNCPSCGITNPDEQNFCGKCGANLRETVQSLSERVAKLELRAKSAWHFVAQKNLDIETAEKVVARVQDWTKKFLFSPASRPAPTCTSPRDCVKNGDVSR
jgi:zinc-ribbon domain